MRDDLISRFTGKDALQEYLSDKVEFTLAVSEFCVATKLKAAIYGGHTTGNAVCLLTENGHHGGILERKVLGYGSDAEMRYVYTGPFVEKQRSGRDTNKNQRDAKKITGIITSIRKQGEIPTEEKMLIRYTSGVSYGFRSCTAGHTNPTITTDSEETLALVQLLLEPDKSKVIVHKGNIERKYEQYLHKMEKLKEAQSNLTRFTSGAKIIGIIPNKCATDPRYYYMVGEATFDTKANNATIQGTLDRYDSLADSPLAADAVIIRTYTSSQSWYEKDNELGFPMQDKYHEEIDVGVGYSSHETGWWTVLPKNAG